MGSSTIFREIKDLTDRPPRLTIGGHVAKWDVLVGDMSRNGMFYWAFGQTILNLSRLRSGSLEKNMRACRNTGRCFHCGEVGFGWEGCVLNTFRFVDPWATMRSMFGLCRKCFSFFIEFLSSSIGVHEQSSASAQF